MKKYLLFNLDGLESTPVGRIPVIMAICDTKEEMFVEIIEALIAFGFEEDRTLMSCTSYDEIIPILEANEDDILLKVWEWEP